jgi:hypothetical protein
MYNMEIQNISKDLQKYIGESEFYQYKYIEASKQVIHLENNLKAKETEIDNLNREMDGLREEIDILLKENFKFKISGTHEEGRSNNSLTNALSPINSGRGSHYQRTISVAKKGNNKMVIEPGETGSVVSHLINFMEKNSDIDSKEGSL